MHQICRVLHRESDRTGLPPSRVDSRINSWISCKSHDPCRETRKSTELRCRSWLHPIPSGTASTSNHPGHSSRVYKWHLLYNRCFRSIRPCIGRFSALYSICMSALFCRGHRFQSTVFLVDKDLERLPEKPGTTSKSLVLKSYASCRLRAKSICKTNVVLLVIASTEHHLYVTHV